MQDFLKMVVKKKWIFYISSSNIDISVNTYKKRYIGDTLIILEFLNFGVNNIYL